MKSALRWAMVFPTSLVAGFVSMAVVAVLYRIIAWLDFGFLPGLLGVWVYQPIGAAISSGVGAYTAVSVASAVAPSHKRETAFSLAAILAFTIVTATGVVVAFPPEDKIASYWLIAIVQMVTISIVAFCTAADTA